MVTWPQKPPGNPSGNRNLATDNSCSHVGTVHFVVWTSSLFFFRRWKIRLFFLGWHVHVLKNIILRAQHFLQLKSEDCQVLPSLKLTYIAPDGWLKYKPFLLGFGLFSGAFAVSFRENKEPPRDSVPWNHSYTQRFLSSKFTSPGSHGITLWHPSPDILKSFKKVTWYVRNTRQNVRIYRRKDLLKANEITEPILRKQLKKPKIFRKWRRKNRDHWKWFNMCVFPWLV